MTHQACSGSIAAFTSSRSSKDNEHAFPCVHLLQKDYSTEEFATLDAMDYSSGNEGFLGLNWTANECSVVVLNIPWDPTASVGRGTSDGGDEALRYSKCIDLVDDDLLDFGLGRPWKYGIFMGNSDESVRKLNNTACCIVQESVDNGERECKSDTSTVSSSHECDPKDKCRAMVDGLSEQLNTLLHKQTGGLLDQGSLIGVVGGDHSCSFGAIKAFGERCAMADQSFGVLHVDAHLDMRRAYQGYSYSHASSMRNVIEQVPAVQTLVSLPIRELSDEDLDFHLTHAKAIMYRASNIRHRKLSGEPWTIIAREIIERLPSLVWISMDMDALSPEFCPGTGCPVPGGLSYDELCELLLQIVRSGRRLVGWDLVELGNTSTDANVACRLIYKLAGLQLIGAGARDVSNNTPKLLQHPTRGFDDGSGFVVPYIVKPSSVADGCGVFAMVDIPKGSLLWLPRRVIRRTRLQTEDMIDSLGSIAEKVQFLQRVYFWAGSCVEITDEGQMWNHSNTQSNTGDAVAAGLNETSDAFNPDAAYATRDIKAGEELLDNYSEYEFHAWFEAQKQKYGIDESWLLGKKVV